MMHPKRALDAHVTLDNDNRFLASGFFDRAPRDIAVMTLPGIPGDLALRHRAGPSTYGPAMFKSRLQLRWV